MGRPVTLTPDIARKLSKLWRLSGPENTITDEQICDVVGITVKQLDGWLTKDTRPKSDDGRRWKIGLRGIRTRAKARSAVSYLKKHRDLIKAAIEKGDYKAAIKGHEWEMEHVLPKVYGSRRPVAGEDSPDDFARKAAEASAARVATFPKPPVEEAQPCR